MLSGCQTFPTSDFAIELESAKLFGNDLSTSSPTETLLRLLLPLDS